MRAYYKILLYILASAFKSQGRLAAENIALRHQILVLKRKHRGRIRLRGLDRVILSWLSRMGPTVADAIIIVKPETLVRWHRLGFRAFWRWKSGSVGGRPQLDKELRGLILLMAAENPLWGAPRIHGELLKLGFELSQATVSNYIRRHPRPRGQAWRTFIDNHRDAIAATDLFVVPTIGFKLMYGIAVIHLKRRELVWTNATLHPTAEWIAQQLTEAFPWERAPSHLIRDRDASYGAVFKRRLNSLGYPRPPNPATLALAKRLCRTDYRFNPPRILGSHYYIWRGTLAPDAEVVCQLLQSDADPTVAGQRFTDSSTCSATRRGHGAPSCWRTSSRICPVGVIGRDNSSALQSGHPCHVPAAGGCWKTDQACYHSLYAKAADNPQRNRSRTKTMVKCLTYNTVAHPA